MNRLHAIDELCRVFLVNFHFIAGNNNPADYLSRPVSYRILSRPNYYSGPGFLCKETKAQGVEAISVTIPKPHARNTDEVLDVGNQTTSISLSALQETFTALEPQKTGKVEIEHFIPLAKFSSFHFLVSVHRCVLRFINNIKLRLAEKGKLSHLKHFDYAKDNLYSIASNQILLTEQRIHFPDISHYFQEQKRSIKSMPNLVGELNLFQSEDSLLRVRSKFGRSNPEQRSFPILLPKNSLLTTLIIRDLHIQYSHAGVYTLLKELRCSFWITHCYSTVCKVLSECITCKRLNERPIKLNQSDHRDFRVDPPSIPFRYIFIDYMGPFTVKWNEKKTKAWVLIITCLWSKAVNMKVCLSADVKDFLRAIQLHIYEFGMFEHCFSDLGSK